MATFFNEYFGVTTDDVDDYGAFNVSLINDLPLFIDPFLLFNSSKPEHQQLHSDILRYMIFLRDKVTSGEISPDLVKSWFMFPEVRQNWLGFSLHGNGGSGLGKDFAEALIQNLGKLFADFGAEKITKSSHIEKVCLIRSGVGRDMISDFTTNLLKDYICRYTEKFAVDHIDASLRKRLPINKALFNFETEHWERQAYDLPYANGDFVLLTPKDMLTRDENWINRTDMIRDFERIPVAIPDAELRGQVFNYFQRLLVRRRPLTTRMWENLFREMEDAALSTDLRLYEEALAFFNVRDGGEGFQFIIRQTDRFVVTSIDRGSVEITGAVLLAAGWIYKKFIEPGWEKSESKKAWDDAVADMIDKSVPILKEQIDFRVVHRLKRLNIRRISLRPPSNNRGFRLADNSTPDTELIYDKSKQIANNSKKESPP